MNDKCFKKGLCNEPKKYLCRPTKIKIFKVAKDFSEMLFFMKFKFPTELLPKIILRVGFDKGNLYKI